MGIINRFLIFLYTLFIAVLSIGVILLVVKLVPEQYVINEYQYLAAQWQTAAGALLFFLLSIHLLCCSLFNGSKEQVSRNDIILVNTDSGSVQVTLEAVREMINRLSDSTVGVRESKTVCQVRHGKENDDKLEITLKLIIGQDRNIGLISDDIRGKIDQHMKHLVGINAYELKIEVESIAGGVAVKKRRVIN